MFVKRRADERALYKLLELEQLENTVGREESERQQLVHRCYRQVNKRLALEIALYHLDGSRADEFSRANWKLGELKQRHDTAKVGG